MLSVQTWRKLQIYTIKVEEGRYLQLPLLLTLIEKDTIMYTTFTYILTSVVCYGSVAATAYILFCEIFND